MKKTFFAGTIIALLGISIVSCSKEILENEISETINTKSQLDNSIPLISNPRAIADYLKNTFDKDDEKISTQLHDIGLKIRDLFKDNTYNELILAEAKKRDNSCIDLRQFISAAKQINLAKHTAVLSDLETMVSILDLTHRSTNPLSNGVVENYIPAIFVANIDNADFSKLPITSAGTYVNSDLSGLEQYHDFIVAWYADENGIFHEFIMNEETAMSTKHPIFIIDNAEKEITERQKSTEWSVPTLSKNPETAWYSSYEYQINHRYDNTRHSEFCITGAQITENGDVWYICRKNGGTFNSWKKISDVHKNNVGSLRYQWEEFCPNNVTPLNTNFIFWNTFERDWAKSEKDLGNATRNGKTIYLRGRRTYTSEWYAYDPNTLNNNPVDLNTIYWSWAKWHDNSKGKFRIWRIQP